MSRHSHSHYVRTLYHLVILSIIDLKYGLCSAGEPGYLDFDNLPETNFSCQGKVIGGYYADVEAGCQMFHVCTIGQKDEIMDIKFLCLNGTVFDQETRVCERVDEVDCSKSERFYNLNLELYGNNAVTLSLHEEALNNDESPSLIDSLHQTTSVRTITTTVSSTTTTPIPGISSTTSSNDYPQHFPHQPPFSSVQTSQSKSRYDDKNGGYHRQYIYHNGDNQENDNNANNNNENQATSYQLFSNQGASSTTGTPQIHQISSSVSPLFRATSATLQTLLTGNANNNPPLINPIFHNHGIISTTEQFTLHNNNARQAAVNYQRTSDNVDDEGPENSKSRSDERTLLEPIQSTNQGKISKLTISPVPREDSADKIKHDIKEQSQSQSTSHQHRISGGFLTIAPSDTGPPTVRSFYPTPKTSKSQSSTTRVTQHIHLPPPPPIPQLKPHQVTIHLSPPEIQRLVQNPSPLLPSQSRVIVTAKASVSDESGRPLNTTQLVTLPLPTIPASYDDYKEGDESFDPFYRDVPKIRNSRNSDDSTFRTNMLLLGQPRKKRQADVEIKETTEELTTIASINTIEESPNITSTEGLAHDDYQQEEYDEDVQYLNDSETTTALYDDENTNSTEDISHDNYDYDEYDDDKNVTSVEYSNDSDYLQVFTTEEPNMTTEQIEQHETTVKDNENHGNDTVLKFTEEITPPSDEPQPETDKVNDPKLLSTDIPPPDDVLSQDYVDDNYEPESYREPEKPVVVTENVTEIKIDQIFETTSIPAIVTTSSTTLSTPIDNVDIITTTTPTTMVTRKRYTTVSTTSYRPTPPKLKTFSTRRTYIYSPPTTTAVPVMIKTRLPLLNPKPAKPPKSYNELAPKPVIRKRPLLARRVTSSASNVGQQSDEPEEVTTAIINNNKTPLEGTTEKTPQVLSDKLLEKISETIGEKIIEQINNLTITTYNSNDFINTTTVTSVTHATPLPTPITPLINSSSPGEYQEDTNMTTQSTTLESFTSNTTPVIDLTTGEKDLSTVTSSQIASVLPIHWKPMVTYKRVNSFNCLEKEMYRFYADERDCRLFHYCSPGFTDKQVLDFRFVCEQGTIFDEDTQNCLHQVKNSKCREKTRQTGNH
ncbi:mucin-2-like isoform X2 [Diachasmimorpha longicaudata]|uniref:mucin-2-like isoform X2 n=1 Tax=Diachasmimorpha longicaudata TaxID=58733 RepID=UPI0030B8F733